MWYWLCSHEVYNNWASYWIYKVLILVTRWQVKTRGKPMSVGGGCLARSCSWARMPWQTRCWLSSRLITSLNGQSNCMASTVLLKNCNISYKRKSKCHLHILSPGLLQQNAGWNQEPELWADKKAQTQVDLSPILPLVNFILLRIQFLLVFVIKQNVAIASSSDNYPALHILKIMISLDPTWVKNNS